MTEHFHEIGIHDLKHLLNKGVTDNLADDFIMGRYRYDGSLSFLEHPCRLNGYCAFYCLKGDFSVDLNLKTFGITDNTLVIYTPGNILQLKSFDPEMMKDAEIIVLAASRDFIHDMKIDLKKLYEESLIVLNNPCIHIEEEGRMLLKQYYDLTESLIRMKTVNVRESIRSLVSSVFYLFGAMWSEHILQKKEMVVSTNSLRANIILENFLDLVEENHDKERQVSFYADKLYLTPKYLSKLIKSVSGRSAPDWINSFVILEAKNLLKYSDMSIKEIVYKLHFSSVPSFYKFFRKQTGMTPMDYRKS